MYVTLKSFSYPTIKCYVKNIKNNFESCILNFLNREHKLFVQGTPRCPPALGIMDGINLTALLLSFFFDFLPCEQSSMFFFLSFFSSLLRIRNLVWNQSSCSSPFYFYFFFHANTLFFSFLLWQQIIPTITEKEQKVGGEWSPLQRRGDAARVNQATKHRHT